MAQIFSKPFTRSPSPAFLYAVYMEAWQLRQAPGCFTTFWRSVKVWSLSM